MQVAQAFDDVAHHGDDHLRRIIGSGLSPPCLNERCYEWASVGKYKGARWTRCSNGEPAYDKWVYRKPPPERHYHQRTLQKTLGRRGHEGIMSPPQTACDHCSGSDLHIFIAKGQASIAAWGASFRPQSWTTTKGSVLLATPAPALSYLDDARVKYDGSMVNIRLSPCVKRRSPTCNNRWVMVACGSRQAGHWGFPTLTVHVSNTMVQWLISDGRSLAEIGGGG